MHLFTAFILLVYMLLKTEQRLWVSLCVCINKVKIFLFIIIVRLLMYIKFESAFQWMKLLMQRMSLKKILRSLNLWKTEQRWKKIFSTAFGDVYLFSRWNFLPKVKCNIACKHLTIFKLHFTANAGACIRMNKFIHFIVNFFRSGIEEH